MGKIIAIAFCWADFCEKPYFLRSGTATIPPPAPKRPFIKPIAIPNSAVNIFLLFI